MEYGFQQAFRYLVREYGKTKLSSEIILPSHSEGCYGNLFGGSSISVLPPEGQTAFDALELYQHVVKYCVSSMSRVWQGMYILVQI